MGQFVATFADGRKQVWNGKKGWVDASNPSSSGVMPGVSSANNENAADTMPEYNKELSAAFNQAAAKKPAAVSAPVAASAKSAPAIAPNSAPVNVSAPADKEPFSFTNTIFGKGADRKIMGVDDPTRKRGELTEDMKNANLEAAARGEKEPYNMTDIALNGMGEDMTDPLGLVLSALPFSSMAGAASEVPALAKGAEMLADVPGMARAGKAIKGGLTALGIMSTGKGAVDIGEGYSKGATTPEGAKQMLEGGAEMASGAPAIGQMGSTLAHAAGATKTLPEQVNALTAALPVSKDTELPDMIARNLPTLQATAKKMGMKATDFRGPTFVTGGDPGNYRRFTNVVDQAVKDIESQYKPALQAYGGYKLSGNPIVKSVTQDAAELFPSRPDMQKKMIDIATKRYSGKWFTLNQLDAERQQLNSEVSALKRKNAFGQWQAMDDAKTGANESARKATRNLLFNELSRRSGTDFSPIKVQQSELMELREAAKNALPGIERGQATHESLGSIGRMRQGLETGLTFHSTRPAVGRALLSEAPEASVGRHLASAFKPNPLQVDASDLARGGVSALTTLGLTGDNHQQSQAQPQAQAQHSANLSAVKTAAFNPSDVKVGASIPLKNNQWVKVTKLYPDGHFDFK